MPGRILFTTGTDTGVGKTILTRLLARHLRTRGIRVAALKPVCSGGREDARQFHRAIQGGLALDEINPWHFRAPLAPLLAARRERRRVRLSQVVAHIRGIQERFDVVLVEGAGGLLSPLGEGFDARGLITALRATPIVVCPNRLGALNSALLTLEALPQTAVRRARVVLVDPPRADSAVRTNRSLLAELLNHSAVLQLPWLQRCGNAEAALRNRRVREVCARLIRA